MHIQIFTEVSSLLFFLTQIVVYYRHCTALYFLHLTTDLGSGSIISISWATSSSFLMAELYSAV